MRTTQGNEADELLSHFVADVKAFCRVYAEQRRSLAALAPSLSSGLLAKLTAGLEAKRGKLHGELRDAAGVAAVQGKAGLHAVLAKACDMVGGGASATPAAPVRKGFYENSNMVDDIPRRG